MSESAISGYFDYNATTPISESVAEKMTASLRLFCNASSSNSAAEVGKHLLRDGRERVAELLSCDATKIAFTSGGSEANNWAIKSHMLKFCGEKAHIITSAIEHPSVLDTIKYLCDAFNFEVTYLQPNESGAISADALQAEIRPDTRLISVMYANNESGAIQPIKEIANLAQQHGIKFHVDGVQIIGKKSLNVTETGADYVSFSAHKFYGPKGIGGLYIREPDSLDPLIHGGGQEMGMRAGTENLMAIAGLSQAAQDCISEVENWDLHYQDCKAYLIDKLDRSKLDVLFNGTTDTEKCVSNTVNFSIQGVRGEAVAAFLDKKYGITISIGSACSNNKEKKLSHVLKAMGLSETRIQSAIRVSFGRYTSHKDIDSFVERLEQCSLRLLEFGAL